MEKGFKELSHSAQRAAVGKMAENVIRRTAGERAKALLRIVDLTEFFLKDTLPGSAYEKARKAVGDPDGRWWKMANEMLDSADPNVAKTLKNGMALLGIEVPERM